MHPGIYDSSNLADNGGGFERPGVPSGTPDASIERKDFIRNLGGLVKTGRDVAESRGNLADIDLGSLSDIPNDGASVVPINSARESDPISLAGFHQFVLSDSGRVLRCLVLWDLSRSTRDSSRGTWYRV